MNGLSWPPYNDTFPFQTIFCHSIRPVICHFSGCGCRRCIRWGCCERTLSFGRSKYFFAPFDYDESLTKLIPFQSFLIYMISIGIIYFVWLYIDIRLHVSKAKKAVTERERRMEQYEEQMAKNAEMSNGGGPMELRGNGHANGHIQMWPMEPAIEPISHKYCFATGRHGELFYLKLGAACKDLPSLNAKTNLNNHFLFHSRVLLRLTHPQHSPSELPNHFPGVHRSQVHRLPVGCDTLRRDTDAAVFHLPAVFHLQVRQSDHKWIPWSG